MTTLEPAARDGWVGGRVRWRVVAGWLRQCHVVALVPPRQPTVTGIARHGAHVDGGALVGRGGRPVARAGAVREQGPLHRLHVQQRAPTRRDGVHEVVDVRRLVGGQPAHVAVDGRDAQRRPLQAGCAQRVVTAFAAAVHRRRSSRMCCDGYRSLIDHAAQRSAAAVARRLRTAM